MTKYHTVCYLGNPEGGQYVTTFDLFSDKNQVDLPNSHLCGCRFVHALESSKTWKVGCAHHVGREVMPMAVVTMQRDIVQSWHRQLLSSSIIYILRIQVGLHTQALSNQFQAPNDILSLLDLAASNCTSLYFLSIVVCSSPTSPTVRLFSRPWTPSTY